MDFISVAILALIFLAGFIALYLFFKADLDSLRRSLDATKDTVSSSLRENTTDIHNRLMAATVAIGELKREAGAFTEVSRSMKELHEFLRSPKLRGNIGEMVLKDLISQMFPKSSYQLQYQFKSGEKVDAAITTDAGILPIDSKFPMENYQKLVATVGAEKETYKKAFVRDIKAHITAIAKKYILPGENTLDFALMYIPSESVFYELVGIEDLMEYSRSVRVYPVSPNTLYAALQTILLSFEGKKIESRAKEVWELIRAVEKDYTKTSESLSTLGSHLTNAYNKFSDVDSRLNTLGQKLASSHKLEPGEEKLIQS